jgi:outer membrane protein OmpA-like peptidoglycan-associated protein
LLQIKINEMRHLTFVFFLYALSLSAQEKIEVFFDFNKAEINTTAQQKLETWIASNEAIEVSKIYGYCDWKGTNHYNDTLSLKRVDAVYQFLIKNKIKVLDNYEVRGFGEDFKQSKVQSENRKVTVFFQKVKKEASEAPKLDDSKTLEEKFKEAKVGDVIVLKNIYFKNRSPRIVPESKPTLYELLCVLEDHPNMKIQIQGHICCQLVGDFEDISTLRARAVYTFLIQNKINRKRLSYKGFGISKPIHPIPEKSEQEANENRRVEILILER